MHAITILGVVAAFGLLFLSLLVLCAEYGFRLFSRMRCCYGRLPVFGRILRLVFVGTFIVYASTKSDGDDGSTNAPSARMSAPRRILSVQPGVTISESETNRGYRVCAIRYGDGVVVPGNGAVTNEAWRLRGGMDDAFRIGTDPESNEDGWVLHPHPHWQFPWGNSWIYGLTVFAHGEFQPDARTEFFPRPFEVDVSLVPSSKWEDIADCGRQSLFWHELTPSNSIVLTWQNALYGRDANAPTNFQAELFGDGSFEYRYPDRTVSYAPVFPFDWDGDGLENSVDPDPLVASPDAHGANAEWYNTVCSNVFGATEGPNGLILAPRHEDVNTNAYYFVDIVAERGPAPIYFTADGPSRLGNPVVIAQAGMTNRVPLLIGPDYCVSSSVPVSIFAPADVLLTSTGDSQLDSSNINHVRWPVVLDAATLPGPGIETFSPTVSEGERLLGKFDWTSGCCTVRDGSNLTFQCRSCACSGCSATLTYGYQGYLLSTLIACGCVGNGGPVSEAPSVETDSGGRIAVGFDRQYLFIAEPDLGSTNEVLRSTQTVLRLQADGGIQGGILTVRPRNFEKLTPLDAQLPESGEQILPPYATYEIVVTNKAHAASKQMHDVEIVVTFKENNTNLELQRRADLTICKFSVEGIKFNHNPGGFETDAINIRADGSTDGVYDVTNGEWNNHGTTNLCACYVGGTRPVVQVRLSAEPSDIASASFSAEASNAGFVLGNLRTNRVAFVNGKSPWVDFTPVETNAVPVMVKKYSSKWLWNIHTVEEETIEPFLLGSSGSHCVYTVLAPPRPPWHSGLNDMRCAWVSALERVAAWADGATTEHELLVAVTSNLFYNAGFRYDTRSAQSRYYSAGTFNLTAYSKCEIGTVNCLDQAYGVVALSNLAGTSAVPVDTATFGYVHATNVVGVGLCNNPVYECEGLPVRNVFTNGLISRGPYVPNRSIICANDDADRTFFWRHVYVVSAGKVFDACLGPIMGDVDINAYLDRVIDRSTTNECFNGFYSPIAQGRSKMLPWDIPLGKVLK